MPNLTRSIQYLLLSFALALCGCGSDTEHGLPANGEVAMALEACGPKLRNQLCGRWSVPENPTEPEGRQISLNVVVLPAIAQNHEPDPLFILAGGPGEAATDFTERLPPVFRQINEDRDIVLIDQRGTGQSNPLNCRIEENDQLRGNAAQQYYLDALLACLAEYDADTRYYTTPFAVDDFDAVREALGYEQINLWGVSYGTRAAMVYMRRHPQSIRSTVLDSVAPLGRYIPFYAGGDGQRALQRLLENCQQNSTCNERFPNLLERSRDFIAEIERQPLTVEIKHPRTEALESVVLDGRKLSGLARLVAYDRTLASLIPLLLDSTMAGDYRLYSALIRMGDTVGERVSMGMHFSVLCAADYFPGRAKNADGGLSEVLQSASEGPLEFTMVDDMGWVCENWPRGFLPDDYFAPVEVAVPTLLLSGELDPITPPAAGQMAAEQLANSRHLVVAGAHHGVSFAGCASDLVVEFVRSAQHGKLRTACLQDVQPVPPFLSSAGPGLSSAGLGLSVPKNAEVESD